MSFTNFVIHKVLGTVVGKVVTGLVAAGVVATGVSVIYHFAAPAPDHHGPRGNELAQGQVRTFRVIFPFKKPDTAMGRMVYENNGLVTYMNWVRTEADLSMAKALASAVAGDPLALIELLKEMKSSALAPFIPREDLPVYQAAQADYQGTHVPAYPLFFQEAPHGELTLIQKTGIDGIVLRGTGEEIEEQSTSARYANIFKAIENDDTDAVRHMLAAKPDLIHATYPSSAGVTPLHYAADYNRVKIVELLLDKGADLEVRTGHNRDTPLLLAAREGSTEVVRLLLKRGANIEAADYKGRRVLQRAVVHGRLETVRLLLSEGADVTTTDNWGRTPLENALQQQGNCPEGSSEHSTRGNIVDLLREK